MNAEQRVIDFIKSNLLTHEEDIPLEADDNLLERGPIDSMGVVQLMGYLESEFDVRIKPREVTIKNFQSVTAMVSFIERKQSEAAGQE